MKLILYLLLACTVLFSCTPEPLPSPCKLPDCSDTIKSHNSTLELVWQKPLRWDKEYTPAVYITDLGDEVVFNYDLIGQSKLYFINKIDTTGQRFYQPVRGAIKRQFYHAKVGLVAYDYKSIYAGNSAATMQKIASAPEGQQFSADGRLIGDMLYTFVRDYSAKTSYIYKFNINDGTLAIDREIRDSECSECKTIISAAPNLIVTNRGDSILLYYKLYSVDSDKDRWLIESFLLSNGNKTKLWESDNPKLGFGEVGSVAYNNFHINIGKTIRAVNTYTGEIVWEQPNNVKGSDWYTIVEPVLIDNKIYLTSSGRFYVVNADNGVVEYESDVIYSSSTESKLTYFEGVIYWTASDGGASKLYGMRLSDRKLVLRMSSPNYGKKPYYNDTNYDKNGLIIDTATRLAYTADGFFAQCFKIPENFGK